MAAAAEWENGSDAGPNGDSAMFASPVKARARAPESEAGTSAVTASESSEARVDDGNIQEAESSLREGLSLNYEVSNLCPHLPFLPFRPDLGGDESCVRCVWTEWDEKIGTFWGHPMAMSFVAFGGKIGIFALIS